MRAKFLALLAIAMAAGYGAGHALSRAHRPASRAPSSLMSVNHLATLPCPSEEQYRVLREKVHLQQDIEGQSTCDSSRRATLAKLLYLLDSLRVDPPEGWGGVAFEMLRNPAAYVGEMTPILKVDLTQTNSVAYNFSQREVDLGAMFFTSDPLYALMVLVHESRHSSPDDPGHARCLAGDIAKTEGGCDEAFSISKNAGAYSFSVLFELGVAQYHTNLAEEDREYLRSAALTMIGNRFNEVPPSLATPHDLLLLLGQSGATYLLNPYDLTAAPLAFPQKFTRVEHNVRNGGALLFHPELPVYSWSRLEPFQAFNADVVSADLRFKDVNKMYVGADRYATTVYVRDDGRLLYIENNNPDGVATLNPFRVQPLDNGINPKRVLTADVFSGFTLGEDGHLYILMISTRGPGVARFQIHRPFADRTFTQVTGGITTNGIYGISEGRLYREGPVPDRPGLSPVLSDFQGQGLLVKYEESTNYRALLNSEGQLFLRRFESELESRIDLKRALPDDPIVDFTVVRHHTPNRTLLAANQPALASFLTQCGASLVQEEPWLGQPIGIGRNGYLTLGTKCQELRNLGQIEGYEFVASPGVPGKTFPQVGLELTYPGGGKRFVYPYENREKELPAPQPNDTGR